jgi:hypothetical protein
MGRGERSRSVLHISPYRVQGNPVLIGSEPTIKQKRASKIELYMVGAVHPNRPAIESIAPIWIATSMPPEISRLRIAL